MYKQPGVLVFIAHMSEQGWLKKRLFTGIIYDRLVVEPTPEKWQLEDYFLFYWDSATFQGRSVQLQEGDLYM